jgi:hypothetical protein
VAQTAEITTLVVPVPEADGAVEGWRTKHDWSARAGVPSHITLLGPSFPLTKSIRTFWSGFGPCSAHGCRSDSG